MTDPRYPIGRFSVSGPITSEVRQGWINEIEAAPAALRQVVLGLTDAQLDTPYREGGWTVRQVVHHMADSHMNAYLRFRWALTEEDPILKAYDTNAWANLPDSSKGPIEVSLALFESLHQRWVMLLNALTETDYSRTVRTLETTSRPLNMVLGVYAFHGRHHVAHITALRQAMGW